MIEVKEVQLAKDPKTRLWFSEKVQKEVAYFRRRGDPNGAFWMKLKRCCEIGFAYAEQGGWPIIKHEWDGVCRIGIKSSVFRIVGFYAGDNKTDFIAIDAFEKQKGQRLSVPEQALVNVVVGVKKGSLWRKVTDDGYPRLAK